MSEPRERDTHAPPRRRAVVLFPPGEDVADLEALRRRWDPVMAARIAAHVTVVHDVGDHARADELLRAVVAERGALEITLTTTACWGRPAWGVYLAVEDHGDGVRALHDALADVEDPRWLRHGFRPHVTVVHGRYVDAERAEAAWAELAGWSPQRRLRLAHVAVVEMGDDGWSTIAELPLGAG